MEDGRTNEELLELYQMTGDAEIKKELTLRYLYIVKSIAVQMRDVYLGFTQVEDIINEGVIVLMKALDKYDVSKNARFETYVSRRIRGMIIDIGLGSEDCEEEFKGDPGKADGNVRPERCHALRRGSRGRGGDDGGKTSGNSGEDELVFRLVA